MFELCSTCFLLLKIKYENRPFGPIPRLKNLNRLFFLNQLFGYFLQNLLLGSETASTTTKSERKISSRVFPRKKVRYTAKILQLELF